MSDIEYDSMKSGTATLNRRCIYIIGSLRNENVPLIGNQVRAAGYEAFDDWYGVGPKADDHWQEYERLRGTDSVTAALNNRAAQSTFQFDRDNIDRSDAVVLTLPAGRSGHLEFGYARGRGKPGVILFDGEPERWDVMYNFASGFAFSVEEALTIIAGQLR